MIRKLLLLGLLAVGLGGGWGCGGPGGTSDDDDDDVVGGCSDQDLDGYGVGSECLGPDCDDTNPEVWTEDQCIAQCEDDPHATGCACDRAANPEPEICYSGPEGTLGVGRCRAGLRSCTDEGVWTSCEGQELPGIEACDDIDNDCDGEIDEGVRNECGTCAADCEEECVGDGEGCVPFDVEEEGQNVEECEGIPNCITLGARAVSLHVIWIVDTNNGTISKIDTDTREELGRYYTAPEMSAGGWSGASPSRTSVDFMGDVVVANRQFNGQPGSATKFAWDCPAGDTSSGGDDILEWGDDACMLWHTDVGNPSGIARAAAVQDRIGLDGVMEEVVWIGLYSERRYLELDRTNGELTGEEANTTPCTPYGAAIDRDGNLWSGCLSMNLARFDTNDTDDVQTWVMPSSNYGLTVDGEGIVWTGGTCQKYDPFEDEFTVIPGCSGSGVAADGEGWIWVGGGCGGSCRIDAETLEVTRVAGAMSRGFGVTFAGELWGVTGSQYSIIQPNEPGEEEFELISYGLGNSYCYTDMTGFQHRLSTDPEGFYGHVFEGCDGADPTTNWTAITWDAHTPPGSDIVMSIRVADTLGALSAAPWQRVGSVRELESPTDLGDLLGPGPHGKYLEARFLLVSDDRENRPRLMNIGAQFFCDIPIG